MREAVENLLNELDFPEAPPEKAAGDSPSEDDAATNPSPAALTMADQLLSGLPAWERDELLVRDLANTALATTVTPPYIIAGGIAEVRDEPLLGLHNRDYVSIWALHRLASYTADGPIPFEDYLRRVTKAGWFYGAQLQTLDSHSPGPKLTVLFPTNATKQPSAERGFQSFALGVFTRRAGRQHTLTASGPLFAWRAIQVTGEDGLPTALTEHGWNLISALDGLSLDLPHPPELMLRFMTHLEQHAPEDRWGFNHLLHIAAEGPNRDGLVESFANTHPEWTTSMASSVAQGYVARAREWGLVEPRLVEGRYWLTDVGRALAQKLN